MSARPASLRPPAAEASAVKIRRVILVTGDAQKRAGIADALCRAVGRTDVPIHAGASRRLSLYQIAQIINRVGGYDPNCLMGTPRHEAGPIPPRAGNVCMDCNKLIGAMGSDPFDPWPYCDSLVPTHADWHRERPPGEPRSPKQLLQVLAANPNVQSGTDVLA